MSSASGEYMDTQLPLDLTDFFTLSVDMFTRPTEACQRTWPPPRLLAEKTNDLGCPRPTLSATAATASLPGVNSHRHSHGAI